MIVTDEMVEAAARTMQRLSDNPNTWEQASEPYRRGYMRFARYVLQAAAKTTGKLCPKCRTPVGVEQGRLAFHVDGWFLCGGSGASVDG